MGGAAPMRGVMGNTGAGERLLGGVGDPNGVTVPFLTSPCGVMILGLPCSAGRWTVPVFPRASR